MKSKGEAVAGMTDGGPAYPVCDATADRFAPHPGQTLRDDCAKHVMVGLLIRERISPRYHEAGNEKETMSDVYAKAAYAYADAMLREREKNNGT